MNPPDKRKQKTIAKSPFYALSGNITTPNVSRTPSLHTVASAPDVSDLNIQHLNISDELQPLKPLKKRIMTVPTNLSQFHHPFIVLELLLKQPMECHMGINDNLRPIIDKAIAEQASLSQQQNVIIEQQKLLIEETKLRIHRYNLSKSIDSVPVPVPTNGNNDSELVNFAEMKEMKSVPCAPMAIPPTFRISKSNPEYKALERPNDELQRRPSIQHFASVLQEGYTTHLSIAIIQALVGAFLSGYNISVLNVPSLIIQDTCHINMSQYSSLQSFYCLGGLIGALSIGKIADKFGRKRAIIIYDILFIVSGAMVVIEYGFLNKYDSFIVFVVARGICGIASGIASMIIPVYLGEISPPLIRGAIGTLNQLTVALGLVISETFGYHKIFGNSALWPYLFAMNVILPILQLFTLRHSMPESPKWLITNANESEARKVLQHLRQCSNVDMDIHFTKLINAFQRKKRSFSESETTQSRAEGINYGSIQHTQQKQMKKAQKKKILLYSITIAIGLQILQQFSGINSIFYYSNLTLINANFTAINELWVGSILIVITNFVSVLIPVYLMDKWGRKTLLNISLSGMAFACVGFSLCLMFSNDMNLDINGYIAITFLIAYVISFEIGLGPIPWLMMVEITESKHRAMIVSIATFFNWGSNLLIAQFANKLISYLQFFPFAIICCIGCVLINKYVPETKGKTEIQIQQELKQKII